MAVVRITMIADSPITIPIGNGLFSFYASSDFRLTNSYSTYLDAGSSGS